MIKIKDCEFVRKVLLIHPKKLIDIELSLLNNRYIIDINKLDEHLRKSFGYDEKEHGNLAEFINWKFGKRVLKKIEELLFIKH